MLPMLLPLLPLPLLPPSSWVLVHHVATRLHAKLQVVTPRGPKRVEIEISLLSVVHLQVFVHS